MNTDIRIHIEFFDHAKTRRMMRKLGPWGPVSLLRLWIYAAKNRPSGVLTDMDADDIEDRAGWHADEPQRVGEFFSYLTANRWLDKAGRGAWKVHEWTKYNPWAADSDARTEKRAYAAHVRHHVKKNRPRPATCEHCKRDASAAKSDAHALHGASPESSQSIVQVPETRNQTKTDDVVSLMGQPVEAGDTAAYLTAVARRVAPQLTVTDDWIRALLQRSSLSYAVIAAAWIDKRAHIAGARSLRYLEEVASNRGPELLADLDDRAASEFVERYTGVTLKERKTA